MARPVTTRRDGELYATFECDEGHTFELGPIHDPDPDAHGFDPQTGVGSSTAGSGRAEHVPDEAFCPVCFEQSEELGPPRERNAKPVLR